MDKDRKEICNIISKMLDSPDDIGIYPTTKAFDDLERYCEGIRAEAIGWTHADNCVDLDKGLDPRKKDCSDMLRRANIDLEREAK